MISLSRPASRILAALALACAALSAAGCSRELPVTDADRAVILRVADLADYGVPVSGAERYETFSKTRSFDGSVDLHYEARVPEADSAGPLFLSVMLSVQPGASDARLAQGAQKTGAFGMMRWKGMGEREVAGFAPMGDGSELRVLEMEGRPVGNFFTMRQGRRVYTVMLAGVYVDDAQAWRALVAPRVAAFLDHEPE